MHADAFVVAGHQDAFDVAGHEDGRHATSSMHDVSRQTSAE
jgi:hypothetical protein